MDSVWIEHETHFRKKIQKTENRSKKFNLDKKYRKFKKGKIVVLRSKKQLNITN